MNRFWQAFTNLFRIEDLRNRLFFTLALLAVYRLGAHIPTPGINTGLMEDIFKSAASSSMLGIFDLFSGGTFRRMTIFALGIMPYITASIILQKDHAVHPLLDDRVERHSGVNDCNDAFGADLFWPGAGLSPGRWLLVDDRADADDRFGVHHVAWRADQ